jgi:membrane protease YdiL (CAAX protease family)
MTKTSREARTALGVLATHNLVQNLFLNERGYVTGNLAVSGLLVGAGRSAGLSWEEMGLHPGDVRKAFRMGARASATIGAAALLALSGPKTRSFLLDERAMAGTGREVLERTLIRFPVGTALFEEVAFRGVLPALLRQTRGPAWAEAISATAFGLWHLIPTRHALSGNPLREGMPTGRRAAVILGGSAVAGFAGLGFSRMRRETGSLLAPWLTHTSYNILSYLAAVAAIRLVPLGRISPFPGRPWPDQPR